MFCRSRWKLVMKERAVLHVLFLLSILFHGASPNQTLLIRTLNEIIRGESSELFPNNIKLSKQNFCNRASNDQPLACCNTKKVNVLYHVGIGVVGSNTLFVPIEKNSLKKDYELPPIILNYRRKQMNYTMRVHHVKLHDMKCSAVLNGTLFVLDRATQHNLYHLRKLPN